MTYISKHRDLDSIIEEIAVKLRYFPLKRRIKRAVETFVNTQQGSIYNNKNITITSKDVETYVQEAGRTGHNGLNIPPLL